MASASKPNPKLQSQVLPRVERARALLERWGNDAVQAVVEHANEGEFTVKSSSGERRYVARLVYRRYFFFFFSCWVSGSAAHLPSFFHIARSYQVVLSQAYCNCSDSSPLLCKHIHAAMLFVGANAEQRFRLSASAMRVHLAADIARHAAAAERDAGAAAPLARADADASLVAEMISLLDRTHKLGATKEVKKATLDQFRYLVDAQLKRVTCTKIQPLQPSRRAPAPVAAAAALPAPVASAQFRPARETQRAKRARAGALLANAAEAVATDRADGRPAPQQLSRSRGRKAARNRGGDDSDFEPRDVDATGDSSDADESY